MNNTEVKPHRYHLEKLDVGDRTLVRGDYDRKFHVRVSNRAQTFAKTMLRHGVPITFKTRRARSAGQGGTDEADGVWIERVAYRPRFKRKKRRKPKYILQPA